MARKFLLLGVAGIALVGAARTANTADANTTVTPILPAATTVVATGPAIEINAWLDGWFLFAPCCDYYIEAGFDGVVDFQRPSGWGFQLLGWYEYYFAGDDYYFGARAYRTYDNLTVGPYVFIGDLELGVDFEYTAGSLMVYNDTYFHFDAFHMHTDTRLEFAVNDQVTVFGDIDLRLFDGPFEIEYLRVGVELDLGNITPYAYIHTDLDGFAGVDVGVELERPIGTGPLTLLGEVELGYHPGYGFDVELSVGIRYARAGANTPWWW